MVSDGFIKQFVPSPRSDPLTRKVCRRYHRTHTLDHDYSLITAALTDEAIRKASNSTATGPDGLTSLHLKHLGQSGITFLTTIYNLSIRNATVLAIWKMALILPVLKPGKSPESGASYHPISLLSPVAKILECLLLPSMTDSLSPSSTQHGFRPNHSTTTALLPLASKISEGFNIKKPASRSVVAVDISKAFDTVDITLLLDLISSSDLHPNLVRWLVSYLHGRSASCIHHGVKSKF